MDQIQILDPNEWTYLAEGNQHIILKYIGSTLFLKDKIIRLQKERKIDEETNINLIELYKNLAKYQGPEVVKFLNQELSLNTNQEDNQKFLAQIEEQIRHMRPSKRLSKKVDLHSPLQLCKNLFFDYSTQFEDSVFNFDFEIKPKSRLPIMDETYEIDNVSKFFKVQLQKLDKSSAINELTKDEIDSRLSKYDPHKFFTGHYWDALSQMVDTPENNLRIFHKGRNVDDIKQFVSKIFDMKENSQMTKRHPQILEIMHWCLQYGIVLRIKDMFSKPIALIDEILQYYEEIKSDTLTQDEIELAISDLEGQNASEKIIRIRKFCNFLLMITWSDVSIIGNVYIFDEPPSSKFPEGFSQINSRIYFRLSIVDYDLKHLSKFQEYQQQAKQLNILYQQYKSK